jgi:hypothetical protein
VERGKEGQQKVLVGGCLGMEGQARLEPSTGAEIEGAASTTNSAFWCNTVRNYCKLENTVEMKESGGLSFHFGFLDLKRGSPTY